jgi:hypothetical protein
MRLKAFKINSLFGVALAAGIAAFTVSACGSSNSTITVTSGTSAVSVSGVITTDTTAMATIKTAEGKVPNANVQDGDHHIGDHVCGYSISKNGHTYQVDWYTNSSISASVLQSSGCSSTAQQQFLLEAP